MPFPVDGKWIQETEARLGVRFPASFVNAMLKNLMKELREDGSLAALPLAKDAFMVIEEFDGHYFWPQRRSCKTKGRIMPKAP